MTLDLPYPGEEEVKKRLITAIVRLYQNDQDLLRANVNERSITHRLAQYLQDEFPKWHVDCEYNRRREQKKMLRHGDLQMVSEDIQSRSVIPDIIIHRRGTDENLVVIEVKKSKGGNETKDVTKLSDFINNTEYQYHFGVFFRIGPINDLKLLLFTQEQGKIKLTMWTEDLHQALGEMGYGK